MPKPASDDLPSTQITPDADLEKRTRRLFTAAEKRAFVAEADACKHGALGPFLRTHGLYSQQIATWRRQFVEGGESALSKSAPGPRPKLTAGQKEIEKLKTQNARLERKLEIAQGCIELQKKFSRLIEQANKENES